VAWRTRHALNLDSVPGGVGAGGTDSIVHDLMVNGNGHTHTAGGFGHPVCPEDSTAVAAALPVSHPVGPLP
jgi:hypothetical protein